MAIFYQVKPVKNPVVKDAEPLFYARIKSVGTLSEKELAKRVSERTGIAEGIITSVLCDSMNEVINLVSLGYRVQLPSLGYIYLTINSTGSQSAEEVTSDNVKQICVRMLPGCELKEKLAAKVKLINFDKEVTGGTTEEETTDSEDTTPDTGDENGSDGGDDEGNYPV